MSFKRRAALMAVVEIGLDYSLYKTFDLVNELRYIKETSSAAEA